MEGSCEDRLPPTEVELGGEAVLDWNLEPGGKVTDLAPPGCIGRQNQDDRCPVYFRNIHLKELE